MKHDYLTFRKFPHQNYHSATRLVWQFVLALILVFPALSVRAQVSSTDPAATYPSIQAAIDGSNAGAVITVPTGTYTENLTVSKSLTINGPNVGIAGTGTRNTEAVLSDGSINVTGTATVIIDGFHIYQTNNATPAVYLAGAPAVTLQNTKLERAGTTPGQPVRAIEIASGSGIKNIANNLFTGSTAGGLFGNHVTWQTGVYINGAGSTVNVTGNTFQNLRSAINLDDYNAGISISGNTFNTNGTHLSFGGSTPTGGPYMLGANEFKTPASTIINLSNVDNTFRLDITSSTFNGASFSGYSLANLFLIESAMNHRGRIVSGIPRNGLVTYVAGNQYVVAGLTTIQSAIDYGTTGDVIHVSSGSSNVPFTVTKNLTFEGANKDVCGTTSTRTAETVLVAPATETGMITLGSGVTATFNGFKIDGLGVAYLTQANQSLTIKNSVFELDFLPGKNNLYSASTAVTLDCNYFKAIGGTNDGSSSHIFIGGGSLTATNNKFTSEDAIGSINNSTTERPLWLNLTGNANTLSVQSNIFSKIDIGIFLAANAGNVTIKNNEFSEAKRNAYASGAGNGAGVAIYQNYTPSGPVFIQNNKFFDSETGIRTSSGDASNNLPATNLVTVSNNSFVNITNGSIRIGASYNNSVNKLNAACNYFNNAPVVSTGPNLISSPQLASGADDDPNTVGFQQNTPVCVSPVHNLTRSEDFGTIQAAIDDADTQPGDVIKVDAGTYNESFTVSKTLTFEGANKDVCGTATRTAETVLTAPPTQTGVITLSGSVTATFNGIKIDGVGVAYLTQPNQGLVFKNSVFELDFLPGINNLYTASSTLTLDCNYFKAIDGTNDGSSSHIFVGGGNFSATNNKFTSTDAINNIDASTTSRPVWLNLTGNANNLSVQSNEFTLVDIGILLAANAGNVTIKNNEFSEAKRNAYASGAGNGAGIVIFGNYTPSGPVLIQNNKFFNSETGIRTSSGDASNDLPATNLVTVSNNSFENITNGSIRIGPSYNNSVNKLNAACNYFNNAPVYTTGPNLISSPQLASGMDESPAIGFQQGMPVCTYPVNNITHPKGFLTIQAAIDDAITENGDVIVANNGTYNENVTVTKSLTITGTSTAGTILTPTTPGSGVGFAINAPNVVLQKFTVDKYNYGITINASGTAHKLLDLNTTNNSIAGIAVPYGAGPETAAISNLEINNVTSTGNAEGLEVFVTVTGSKVFDNVMIKNSNFSENKVKGIYIERANNLTIDNVTVDHSGYDLSNSSNNTGIDINLKYANYSGVTIKNSTITNSGYQGTGGMFADGPSAVAVKARDDASSYNTNPASLAGVTILNNTISGPQNGIRIGEYTPKFNAGPSGVVIQNNNLSAPFANKAVINRTAADATLLCNYHGSSTDYDDVVRTLAALGTGKLLLNSVATSTAYTSCISPTGLTLSTNTPQVCVGSPLSVTVAGLLASTSTKASYKVNNGSTQTATATTNAAGEMTITETLPAGSYTLTVTMLEANNVVAAINPPLSVTAVVKPIVVAGTVTGTSPINVGATATYTSTGGTPGGTWSSNNTAVAMVNSAGVVTGVSPGMAIIIYTVTGCGGPVSSQASVTVQQVPDLSPIMYTTPTTHYGTTNFTVVVDVAELNSVSTTGTITVYIPKQPQVSFTLSTTATTVGSRPVDNSVWTLTANNSFYILTTNAVIAGGNKLSFGLNGVLTPGNATGAISISTIILGGSGGEAKIDNNGDVDRIVYFPQ